MRGTDVIRAVLDLIDEIENNKIDVAVDVTYADTDNNSSAESRFKQIFALLNQNKPFPGTGATTAPNPVIADIDSVTTNAGGGVNGPKHPDDIRVKDPRGY